MPGGQNMERPKYFVGIDIASETFTAAAGVEPWQLQVKPQQFVNELDSFPKFLGWLRQNSLKPEYTILCMESTGVYGEALAYFLHANGYQLAVEPPLKVKRAFKPYGPKSDPVDSQQIAEYTCRHWDELHLWQPNQETLAQIKVLLNTREQFVAQSTAHQNALRALQRKVVRTPLAEQVHNEALNQVKKHLRTIEAEIKRLIEQDPTFGQMASLLLSIPGVGLLLASQFLVTFHSSSQPPTHKELASYLGICPHEHSSGSSVHPYATSRHFGPPAMRRLLYLASLSLRTHHPEFRQYFVRKVAMGKPKPLVLNNIANKLLKIMCAVMRTQTPYIPGYRSVNPMIYKKALTMSSYSG
jgi:transposase